MPDGLSTSILFPNILLYSGFPGKDENEVMKQIDADINFIREIKEINPDTEIIIYVYSPVPVEGSEVYSSVTNLGFRFPEKLKIGLSRNGKVLI